MEKHHVGLTVGQNVRVVYGEFAGMSGRIEAYNQRANTFTVRCEGSSDNVIGPWRILVACGDVRFTA